MKKIYAFLAAAMLCFLLVSCAATRGRLPFSAVSGGRMDALKEISVTDRSVTDIADITTEQTEPTYFEVVAAKETDATDSIESPSVSEPKEYFMVKFVDIDGYSAISVQNVEKGSSAKAPPMPSNRNGMVFLGWDKNFSSVQSGMVVKAIYQKEWLTVRFFDIDGTLLKSEEVMYGESATAPYVADKGEYFFDGWNTSFDKVYRDTDVYATYYKLPVRSFLPLTDAFELLPVETNILNLPSNTYYRKEYAGAVTFGTEEFGGNTVYGNFSDTIDISGFGFTSFEGKIALKSQGKTDENTYAINLYIYTDGEQVYYNQLTRTGSYREFSVDLVGVKSLTVRLETFVNGKLYYQYYGSPEFIGGLIDAVIYEN